jgi:ectonucleotide pyrophosphatase/phosphodiesterase family protein 5
MTGHLHGPDSPEMSSKLIYLDEILGYLINKLKINYLFEKLNVIVTSDHGMQTVDVNTKSIYLDTVVDTNLFDAYGSSVVSSLFLKNSK